MDYHQVDGGEAEEEWKCMVKEIVKLQTDIEAAIVTFMVQVSEGLDQISRQRIEELREWAEKLESVQFGTNVASLTGAGVGIVGGGLGLAAISLALAPVTFGTSVIFGLSVAGGVVGGAGAATGIGSVAARYGYQKQAMNLKAHLKEKYKEEANMIQKVSTKLNRVSHKCISSYESEDYLNYPWRDENMRLMVEMSEYISSLSEIYLAVEAMVENNNVVIKKNEEEKETVNMDELVAVEELLDRFDSISERIHIIILGRTSGKAVVNMDFLCDFDKKRKKGKSTDVQDLEYEADRLASLDLDDFNYDSDTAYLFMRDEVDLTSEKKRSHRNVTIPDTEGIDSGSESEEDLIGHNIAGAAGSTGTAGAAGLNVGAQVLDEVAEGAGGAAAKFATAAKVGTALKIAGITLAALGIVLDAVTIGITAKDMHDGSKSKLADTLRTVADNLENKLNLKDNGTDSESDLEDISEEENRENEERESKNNNGGGELDRTRGCGTNIKA